MTPFGAKIRQLRKYRGVTMKAMAEALALTPAYLSALEHGHRGRPAPGLVQQIAGYFDLIWDDVEDLKNLAAISHPKVTLDTSGLDPETTKLANLMSKQIGELSDEQVQQMLAILEM